MNVLDGFKKPIHYGTIVSKCQGEPKWAANCHYSCLVLQMGIWWCSSAAPKMG